VANGYLQAGDAALSRLPVNRVKALAAYDRARAVRPNDLALRRRLLDRYVNLEAYRKAAECLPGPPSSDPALFLAGGQILLYSHRPQEGAALLQLALNATQPNSLARAWTQNNVGYVLADAGYDLPDALRLTQAAAEALAEQSVVIDSVGWAHYRLGHYEEAAFHLEYALRHLRQPTFALWEWLSPGRRGWMLLSAQEIQSLPTIEYHLGAAYARLGRVAGAQRLLRRSVQHDPYYAPAREELRKLRFQLPPAWDEGRLVSAPTPAQPGRNAL